MLAIPSTPALACSGGENAPVPSGPGGAGPTGGDSAITGGTRSSQGGIGAANTGGAGAAGGTAATSGGGGTNGGSTNQAGNGPANSGGMNATGGQAGGSPGGANGKAASGGMPATGGSGGRAATSGGMSGDRGTVEGVCARWKADRADMNEGTWSGDVASCDAGDISADGRANALRLYNLYRWLGNMPAVVTDPTRDRQAQACALMQTANDALSHDPPTTWKCWTQEGKDGSASSNISSGPGVSSVDAYMIDNGNATTLGHRRWILSNSLGPIGLGSAGKGGASCMQNLNGTGKAGKAWVAWPPQGIVPIQAFGNSGGRGGSVDNTGWLVQSDTVSLTGARVSVTANGADAPVTMTALGSGYGSRYAFRFNPSGWKSEAGTRYAVSVTGIATPIEYEVEVVDCP